MDGKINLGAKAAMNGVLTATITVDVKVSRRFIWMMKLRYIWAVIRAPRPHIGIPRNGQLNYEVPAGDWWETE